MGETPRNEDLPLLGGAPARELAEKIKLALEDVDAQLALYSSDEALAPLTEIRFDEFMPAIVGHYGTCASVLFDAHMQAYLAQYSYFFCGQRECLSMLDQIKQRAWMYAGGHFDRWLRSVCVKLQLPERFWESGTRLFGSHVRAVLNGKDLQWAQRALDTANPAADADQLSKRETEMLVAFVERFDNQAQAAKRLGTTERSLRRWLAGQRPRNWLEIAEIIHA